MRNGVLAALIILLAGHGLVRAQQVGSDPAGLSWEPTSPCSSEPTLDNVPVQDLDTHAKTFGLWGSGEYLMWWIKNGRVPPLVTGGGDAIPGTPGTQVLLDNLDFDNDFRQGGRFAVGYQFKSIPCAGVEGGYFFLGGRQSQVSFSSPGDPVLGRPFIDAVTGRPDILVVSSPGIASGTVAVAARTELWGAEANLTAGTSRSDKVYLTALGGFRYLNLEDEVAIGQRLKAGPDVPGFGGRTGTLQDQFRTVNNFYGGQVGVATGARFGLLAIDFRGKVALGQMQQAAYVNGALRVVDPDGSATLFPGALLAQPTNIGRHRRDELAFIPEAGVNVGLQVTGHVKLTAGYSFLWVNTVARAGEQIDSVVNVSQVVLKSGPGPLVGAARPAFHFDGSDFWAQGLTFGLELSY